MQVILNFEKAEVMLQIKIPLYPSYVGLEREENKSHHIKTIPLVTILTMVNVLMYSPSVSEA